LQKYIEDPLSEALIQGSLPRPAELEVYLGDTGIFCRQISKEAEGEPAAVGVETEAGTPLYMF
jgi:ATP-dependent Clp protease ATP-binding subunit ClpC